MRLRSAIVVALVGLSACEGFDSVSSQSSGVIDAPCPTGQRRCEHRCVDVERSDTNCGACGVVCTTRCEAGVCQRAPQLAVGNNSTCVLRSGGELKCWGDNSHGQLGYGDTQSRDAPEGDVAVGEEVAQVSMGSSHTCVRLRSGGIKCWGENTYGQLGYGDTDERWTPDSDVPMSTQVTQIMAAHHHTCAVFKSGELKCWGLNDQGQLGYGDTQDRASPGPDVSLGEAAVQVAGGHGHTCARLQSGSVKCWGLNHFGQLGYADPTSRNTPGEAVALDGKATQIVATFDQTCALLDSGRVQCWGANESGQLGSGDVTAHALPGQPLALGEAASQIALGFAHGCAQLASGEVTCWGANDFGQLGQADTKPRLAPDAAIAIGGKAMQIATGNGHTCALLEDDALKCWGWNQDGQLGYGDTNNVGDNELPESVGAVPYE